MRQQNNNKAEGKKTVYKAVVNHSEYEKFGRTNPTPRIPKSLKPSNKK